MMDHGILIVSLDFELFWGMQDVCSLDDYKENTLGVWRAVPALLSLFETYGIHASWATVGFLFADSFQEIRRYAPPADLFPTYKNMERSTYRIIPEMEKETELRKCFLAPELIYIISKARNQEIACHTFSHYYCLEKGQTLLQFEADIQAALHIADKKKFNLKTIVLPRNQCIKEYTFLLQKQGFQAYRSLEKDWIHRFLPNGIFMKIIRLLDVYFPLTGDDCYLPEKEDGIWNFPGSRMYKPFCKPLCFLERLKVWRIKRQMLSAAKHHKVFHLWWHPHNIGVKTQFHLKQLNEIFQYYQKLQKKYGMQSMNMAEAAEYFESLNKA